MPFSQAVYLANDLPQKNCAVTSQMCILNRVPRVWQVGGMQGWLTCSLAAMARSVLRLRLSMNLPVGLLMLSAGYSSRRSVSVSAWSHGSDRQKISHIEGLCGVNGA